MMMSTDARSVLIENAGCGHRCCLLNRHDNDQKKVRGRRSNVAHYVRVAAEKAPTATRSVVCPMALFEQRVFSSTALGEFFSERGGHKRDSDCRRTWMCPLEAGSFRKQHSGRLSSENKRALRARRIAGAGGDSKQNNPLWAWSLRFRIVSGADLAGKQKEEMQPRLTIEPSTLKSAGRLLSRVVG